MAHLNILTLLDLLMCMHIIIQIPEYANATVSKSGPLEKLTTGLRSRKWKSYTFTIENQTHLKYFKSGVSHYNTVTFDSMNMCTLHTCCVIDYFAEKEATGGDFAVHCD